MLALALLLPLPTRAQQLRPVALSYSAAHSSMVRGFRIPSLDIHTDGDDAVSRLPSQSGVARGGVLPLDPDVPRYRSKYILLGALAGAILGGGGAGLYLAQNCDDCFFAGQFIIASVLGGAVVGGVTGSSLFDWRQSRARRQAEHGAPPP